jgi:YVTN family beta-propeller protein
MMRKSLIALSLLAAGTKGYGVDSAYISGNGTSNIFVFDLITHEQTLTITVEVNPNQTASADSTRVYVENRGENTISVIEAAIGTVIATVATGNTIRGLALSTDNSKLYITTADQVVLVIDTTSFVVTTTIPVANVADIVAGPTNMYVGHNVDPIVNVISQTTQAIIATITVGTAPFNLQFTSPFLYAVNLASDSISIINIGTNQVIATVTVGDAPRDVGAINNLAFVANSDTFDLSVINTVGSPPAVIATITISPDLTQTPQKVAINNLNQKVYVSTDALSFGDPTTLSIINAVAPFPILATLTIDGVIRQFDFTPDDTQLYISIFNVPYFNIIDTSTNFIIATVTLSTSSGANDVAFALEPHPLPPTPPVGILMPTFVRGAQTKNEFLGQTELVNVLTWAPPSSGSAPTTYLVYRNPNLTDLAGTVPASGALQFSDHSRRKKVTYIYYIVSVDSDGTRSSPAILAVAP